MTTRLERLELDGYGIDSMAGGLGHVAMRRPGAILDADPAAWHYAKRADRWAMNAQFDAGPTCLTRPLYRGSRQ